MQRVLTLIFILIYVKAEAQTSALTIADSLYTTGNYTTAINEYAKVGSVKSRLQIARAYSAMGNYEKAMVQYENLLAKNKTMQIAKFELAKLHLKTKEAERASSLLLELIAQDTINPEYFYYMGKSLMRDSLKRNGAMAYFKKAIATDSTHLRSIFMVSKQYVLQQEKDSVLKYADKGLRFYDNDVSLINLKALAFFNDAQYARAIPLFEKLLELKENEPHIYEKLAYCYYRNWDMDKAKENYRKLLQIPGKDVAGLRGLAAVFAKNKQLDSAVLYYKKTIAAKKVTFEEEYSALARLAKQQKDLKTSLRYYKMANREDPSNRLIHYQMCVTADQYYKDPKIKLQYYEDFLKAFGEENSYFSAFAHKRISELKEKIHFAKE